MKPYYETDRGKLFHGDCLEVMKTFPENSIDSLITDAPYGLSFMGKSWDYDVPSVEIWKECLRILKPGAHALIFAGSRTQHRMAVNVEDAGFKILDTIMWIYAQGFPKSTDISKQIDKYKRRDYVLAARKLGLKLPGNNLHDWTKAEHSPSEKWWSKFKEYISEKDWQKIEREVIGKKDFTSAINGNMPDGRDKKERKILNITAPATPEAELWNGWGTHLKPSYEPVIVAMKPNEGSYAQNALKHGVAGLNIDGGRIEAKDANLTRKSRANTKDKTRESQVPKTAKKNITDTNKGRFPANIILDEEAGRLLDQQSGVSKSQASGYNWANSFQGNVPITNNIKSGIHFDDQGGASRFFFCAKASPRDREKFNHHPTVKPLKLMEYLCNLTKTPTGGIVLDPFAGSGTTALACHTVGRPWILIEKEEQYCEIAAKRIEAAASQLSF